MALGPLARTVVAIVAAGAAATLSWLLGAAPTAALPAALLAAALAWGRRPPAPPPPPPIEDREEEDETDSAIEGLLAELPDPILVVARQMVVRANPAALRLFGDHIVGEDVRLAIRHPDAQPLLAPDEAGVIALTGLGDAGRPWELSVAGLAPGLRLARLRDRSDAHTAERVRVDFVANASHELRTPLATLIGFIETLEDANGPADAAVRTRFLTIMMNEARRMQRLIDDLISLSRIEADRFQPPADDLDLAAVVAEAIAILKAGRDDLGERLTLAAPPADPLIVQGDRIQLVQMVHNIVGNALKYGRAGEAVRIAIDRAAGGQARLSVADRGDGIAAEHLPRLTERFYRVDPGRSRAVGGTGLGLSIVKHIVERHRGRLDIASVEGTGSTVTVLLPLREMRPVPMRAGVLLE